MIPDTQPSQIRTVLGDREDDEDPDRRQRGAEARTERERRTQLLRDAANEEVNCFFLLFLAMFELKLLGQQHYVFR